MSIFNKCPSKRQDYHSRHHLANQGNFPQSTQLPRDKEPIERSNEIGTRSKGKVGQHSNIKQHRQEFNTGEHACWHHLWLQPVVPING